MLVTAESNPPYVQFETRAEIDRNESEKQGRTIYKDIDYVVIVPAGSGGKDVREVVATKWLESKKRDVINGRFKREWLDHYQRCYTEWKKGNEVPVIGTPIKLWPVVGPAEVAQLTAAAIRTVEELAECTESGLAEIGMGGRVLRDKARAWLQSAEGNGKVAEQIANLKEEVRRRDETIDNLTKRLDALEEKKRKVA